MNIIAKIAIFAFFLSGFNPHYAQGQQPPPRTPPHSGTGASRSIDQTPGTIVSDTRNYCKDLLIAIAETGENATEKDILLIASAFYNFFTKIAYTLNNIKEANESFYMARFHALCYTIALCSSNSERRSCFPIPHDDTHLHNIIATAISNANNHTYVLEFCIGDDYCVIPNSRNDYKYVVSDHPEEEITVIRVKILLNEDGRVDLSKETFEDEHGMLIEQFRSPKIRQVPNTGTQIIEIQPLQLDDDKPYVHQHPFRNTMTNYIDSQEALRTMFFSTYRAIPLQYHSHLEKFYQAVFADILIFTGMGEVVPEATAHEGRIDILLRTHEGITIIFEFKSSEYLRITSETAIEQIIERHYTSITDRHAELVGVKITPTRLHGFVTDFDIEISCTHHAPKRAARVPIASPQAPHQKTRTTPRSMACAKSLL